MKHPFITFFSIISLFCDVRGDIIYTEVTTSNTSGLTGGSNPWTQRTGFASDDSVWQTFSTNANELATTLSGLTPGLNYHITLFQWDSLGATGSSGDWSVEASFTSGSNFSNYICGGPESETAYRRNLTNTITGINYTAAFPQLISGTSSSSYDEGNRDLWVSDIGNATANSSGEITIYSKFGGTSGRAWLDGFGVERNASSEAPTDIDISNSSVSTAAPIGQLVGVFTTTDTTAGDSFTYSLVDGTGAENNGLFLISGNQLELDRDLAGLNSPLSIRVRTTDILGEFYDEIFTLTLISDSDLDGLSDDWELIYFPNLSIATGTGDNDFDQLSNQDEEAQNTNPTLFDTDEDGLNDKVENGNGIFVSASSTGSSPLLFDTDGDGISDGDEVSSSNGHITNPNLRDSDGDDFPDSLEIAEGTDPTNQQSFPPGALPLLLNEILASNDTDLKDGFGDREDWIEIYNPNASSIDLDGYHLTDDATNLTKWNFPPIVMAPDSYLVIFASGKDTTDPSGSIHTNFQLFSQGEYLAIVRPNGTSIDDSFLPNFPEQFTDISYGRAPSNANLLYYASPTPGLANSSAGSIGVVKDTNFSIDRGFYSTPFSLTITTQTSGAFIRYTTNGSAPSPTEGILYNPNTEIPINTTSTIRAIAYRDGYLPTNVDSQTYIFPDDVVNQPSNPPGWDPTWGYDSQVDANDGSGPGIVPSDYEMDSRVTNNTNGLGIYSVEEALVDIPSVSITMEQSDFTNSATGIYSNPRVRQERVCSVEYIHPDGTPGFQEDCKIEVHGNSSRTPWRMQKHSLRLTFSSSVGIPKLNYPLFAGSDVTTFNKLVLRACFTDSWALNSWSSARYRPNDSMYIRDVWMKNSLGDMGQPTSYGNFVHLYVNGLYFGLHNLTERLEDDWFSDHLGGEEADWEINKDLSEPSTRWNSMMSILNGNIGQNSVYETAKDYIDITNYADYMLLHFYADAEDWPHHNGYAAANLNSGDGKFRFLVWDQEIALDKFSWDRYDDGRGGGAPFQRLRLNQEFRIAFGDRVQKHLFNNGALSETDSIDRFIDLCTEIDKAIVAESARWGDVQASTPYGNTPQSSNDIHADYYPPTINSPIYFTREQHWVVERDNVTNNYIPTLHDPSNSNAIINELRSENLFPPIDAPVLSQHGGIVPINFPLSISASSGEIYYTLDGSDPRQVGGATNSSAILLTGNNVTISESTMLNARALDNGIWSALTSADFTTGVPASQSNIAISEINYHPSNPTPSEVDEGYNDDDDFEFIEITNVSSNPVALSGASFTLGIHFTFPAPTVIAPDEKILVVRNRDAFLFRYPASSADNIAGEFASTNGDPDDEKLSNGGERIILRDAEGTVIIDLTYDDAAPWPEAPDGGGQTLVHRGGDPTVSFNWRPSTILGGNPGTSDSSPFTGSTPEELVGYTIEKAPQMSSNGDLSEFTFTTKLNADDAIIELLTSDNLDSWSPASQSYELISRAIQPGGSEQFTYRRLQSSIQREFVRMQIINR